MKTLKIKKLVPEAVIPKYATEGSAGMDLTAVSLETQDDSLCLFGEKIKYIFGTGLAFGIPEGHVGLLFPRSSICKTHMQLTNCVGVVDSDFIGEVKVVFRRDGHLAYKVGDRVAQLLIVELPKFEIEEVTELTDTVRGTGGYGSTGR